MEISIRARHIGFTADLRQQIERSVEFAIDRYKGWIKRIFVYVSDLNGLRGGVDKFCQITAAIRGGSPVLIVEKGTHIQNVVNRAARRLGYRIGRRTNRKRIPHKREYRATIRAA